MKHVQNIIIISLFFVQFTHTKQMTKPAPAPSPTTQKPIVQPPQPVQRIKPTSQPIKQPIPPYSAEATKGRQKPTQEKISKQQPVQPKQSQPSTPTKTTTPPSLIYNAILLNMTENPVAS